MILFQIASLPLLFVLAVMLPWDRRQAPRTLTLVSTFFKGVLLFLPGYLLILIARSIMGFSYAGFLLYLSLLLRDHLLPVLAALGGFLLIQKRLDFSGTDEGTFLITFAFLAGFLSPLNITDALSRSAGPDAYELFLLPSLRIGTALLLALAANRFYRWEGRDGGMFCGAAAGLAVLLAVSSFLFRANRPLWSIGLAVLAVLAGIVVFALRFPRAVRG